MRRIGVLTSGGDSPGMNANLRAVVRRGIERGLEVAGIMRGYQGLIDGQLCPLGARDVSGIIDRGGTFLHTARCAEFMLPEGRAEAARRLADLGIDGLVVCGGDGSFAGALKLHQEHGVAVVGTPGTIDNDVAGTDHTIGFDTAVQTATEACDKVRDTAYSHERVFVVEVMGRYSGFIAVETALAAGAEVALIPELPARGVAWCAERLEAGRLAGKQSMLIVLAEGAGGGEEVAAALTARLPWAKVRATVLGHVLRGGRPSANDRMLATRTGAGAVDALLAGCGCHHVGVVANQLRQTPLAEVVGAKKPIDGALIELIDTMAI